MRLNYFVFFTSLVVILAHGAGIFLDLYVRYPNFDMLVHFLGGAFTASVFIFAASRHPRFSFIGSNKLVNILVAVGLTILIGVLWEFFEFYVSAWTGIPPQTYADTLSDLFFDTIGGFLSALIAFLAIKAK
jgi:VanZ family protein